MKFTGRCLIILLALSLSLLASCSSFRRDYRAVRLAQADGDFSGLSGAWAGRWTSEPTGHEGPLWCLVEELPRGEEGEAYRFRYRAGWGWFLRGEYEHEVKVRKDGDRYLFSEAMDLGDLGGVYTLESEATATEWNGKHRSTKGDRGDVAMSRPASE